jgi:hypothetical protein
MNKKYIIMLVFVIAIMVVISVTINYLPKDAKQVVDTNEQSGGLFYYPPNLGMYENYTKDAKTYQNKLGFSFQYPPYLRTVDITDEFSPGRVAVIPVDSAEIHGVIISAGLNDENMTPLEWLSGHDSGADITKGYSKFDLDGQEAIVIEGGTWVVVNTPDNKYRLSIALLPGKDDQLLLTEMGIIIDSLRF